MGYRVSVAALLVEDLCIEHIVITLPAYKSLFLRIYKKYLYSRNSRLMAWGGGVHTKYLCGCCRGDPEWRVEHGTVVSVPERAVAALEKNLVKHAVPVDYVSAVFRRLRGLGRQFCGGEWLFELRAVRQVRVADFRVVPEEDAPRIVHVLRVWWPTNSACITGGFCWQWLQ